MVMPHELQIPLVCAGTKDAYLAISSDDQLENRFEPFLLPPWEAGDEFNSLLASYAQLLPLRQPSALIESAITDEILVRTEGILGEIATLLTRAAIKAIESYKECINEWILKNTDYQSPTKRRQMIERQLR